MRRGVGEYDVCMYVGRYRVGDIASRVQYTASLAGAYCAYLSAV